MTRYQQARSDFEYLEGICELEDQVELDAERKTLMENPTKDYAAFLYERAIALWMQENRTEYQQSKTFLAIQRRAKQRA